MKKLLNWLLSVMLLLVATRVSYAAQTPQFPVCIAPTGSVIANYESGTHGIPGTGSKIGKDTVYSQGNENAMQCFCGSDGVGVQTNWLKISELSQDEIKVLENEGWIYIPDGSAWGLSEGAYLAKNINYSCNNSSTTNSGGGDGLTDGRTDGRSDGLGSIVQSSTGSLASTGNILFIAEVFAFGIFLLVIGVFMKLRVR